LSPFNPKTGARGISRKDFHGLTPNESIRAPTLSSGTVTLGYIIGDTHPQLGLRRRNV